MSFEKAFTQLIEIEKGFSNHKADKGGATNWGITKKVYEQWKKRAVTIEEMINMPKSDAKAIYKAQYWDTLSGDKIKFYSVAYSLFDQAVNSGVGTAVMRAQKILGLSRDGKMGPKTLDALNLANERKFLESFIAETKAYYELISNNEPNDPDQAFYKGWINRANHLSSYTLKHLGSLNKTTVGIGVILVAAGFFLLISHNSSKGKI